MKKRIQLAALAGTVLMALSFSACAVDMSDASAVSSTSSESSEAEATPEPVISVDESKYEDNLDGLADYMKKKEYISGDATEMAAAMIGEGTGYEDLTYTIGLNTEEYGVGFRKGSDLAEELNNFFTESYADGSMKECAETYKVQAALIEQ